MNERIQQLKHQASLWCDINVPEQFGEHGYGEVWEDKFAELIVQECVSVLDSYDVRHSHNTQMANLLEHFGVEE
jgi:hypothetical protein